MLRSGGRAVLAAAFVAALSWSSASCQRLAATPTCPVCCPPGQEQYLDEDAACDCRFPRAGTTGGASALIQGFNVPAIPLKRDATQGGRPIFTWAPREGTTDVRCALFQCQPVILSVESSDAVGSTLRTIANFADCVIAYQDFGGSDGLFDLTDFAPFQSAEVGHPCAVPVRLVAGCWSFDEMDVNGASALLPVNAAELASNPVVGARFTATCSTDDSATYGQTCDVPDPPHTVPAHAIGTCLGGTCRARCESASDCGAADATGADASTWSCDEAGLVKVCRKAL